MKQLRGQCMEWDTPILKFGVSPARTLEVPAYRVGEKLRPGSRSWPEGARYSYGLCGHELILSQPRVDPALEKAVGRGPVEFALVVEAPLIVLIYRFGNVVPWGNAPFAWHLQPEESRIFPPGDKSGARTLLGITLVGSDDGVIYAQRSVTLSPMFTRELHHAIREQAMTPFDAEAYVRAVGIVYLHRPQSSALVRRAIARTAGNA
jgi:hypothetical protein